MNDFVAGILVGISIGSVILWLAEVISNRISSVHLESPTQTIVVGVSAQPHDAKLFDLQIDPGFIERAPESFLAGRGQSRKQFANQCAEACRRVEMEQHDSPDSALRSFVEKIGIKIMKSVELSQAETSKMIEERLASEHKKAN